MVGAVQKENVRVYLDVRVYLVYKIALDKKACSFDVQQGSSDVKLVYRIELDRTVWTQAWNRNEKAKTKAWNRNEKAWNKNERAWKKAWKNPWISRPQIMQ